MSIGPVATPEVEIFIQNGLLRTLDPDTLDVEVLRSEMRDDCVRFGGTAESIATIRNVDAGGTPAVLYSPEGVADSVLVWIHGGGWVIGDPECYDVLSRFLANRVGCAVLSVDYRLAPETPYPGAADDCWAATRWASQNFERVAVGGDSAGGNLSAVTALRAAEAGVDLALQLLVYPVLDYRTETPAYQEFRERYAGFAGDPSFGARCHDEIRLAWDYYVPDEGRRTDPWASPLRAPSLSGVAPAFILLAEHDILRDEGAAYARLLREAGVPTELREYKGQIHGFFHMLGAMTDARSAADLTASVLAKAFDGS